MKKWTAFILCAAMLLSLMAGCGGTAAETPASDTETASSVEVASAPVDAPAPEVVVPEEISIVESVVEEVIEPAEPEFVIEYPITDSVEEITMWSTFDTNAFQGIFETYNDKPLVSVVTEKTGVRLVFHEVSNVSSSEQFNLMIAGGDYCDMINGVGQLYNGGFAQAYADDVIIDLTDLLPENCPDFWAIMNSYDAATRAEAQVSGMYLFVCSFAKNPLTDSGVFTRGDWLEELGLDAPTDFESFDEVLHAFYREYQPLHTYALSSNAYINYANTFFDSELFALNNTDLALFLRDGEIVSGMTTDGYREYLEWVIELYNEGIVHQDFYITEMGRTDTMGFIGDDNMGFWTGQADHVSDFYAMAEDENFAVAPVPIPKNDEGYYTFGEPENPFAGSRMSSGADGPCITVDCENVELALQFMNYFFTDEGIMLANYGQEGETYTLEEDGSITYTDLVLNNPNGWNSMMVFTYYGWSHTGVVSYGDRFLPTYSEEVRSILELWGDRSYTTYDTYIPDAAALDVDETNSISNMAVAVTSYASEQLLKFITGAEPLTDESWDAYVAECISLGLEDCVEVYQAAYDDYLDEIADQ